MREGSLETPTRHPLNWKEAEFYDEEACLKEMERVFDICHGCRRCFSLCNAFPTLFDAVDESDTGEIDGIGQKVYWDVVDHCYLCDMCFMTKCPYVPPHEWNLDFPHLMLRAKAIKHKQGKTSFRDKMLTSTDQVGSLAGIPVISSVVNAVNKTSVMRDALDEWFGVHKDAHLPDYHSNNLQKRFAKRPVVSGESSENTQGKVVLFGTCYGKFNEPELGEDLAAIFEHNNIEVRYADGHVCCGMPKLELGDLDAVEELKNKNIPILLDWVRKGYDIVAPIPSCALMFKQELPLMFPDDEDIITVQKAMYDPFEYLHLRYKDGKLNMDFKNHLGTVSYHVPCHLRVQNMGLKTKDVLELVPETKVMPIERCSGHDGTYGVKKEFHKVSRKICKPVVNRIEQNKADHYSSDCPIAGHHIEGGMNENAEASHPLKLLRMAYGI